MKFWLVVLVVSLAFMTVGAISHKITESLLGASIKMDDLATFGSVFFMFGMLGSVFSGMLLLLCLSC